MVTYMESKCTPSQADLKLISSDDRRDLESFKTGVVVDRLDKKYMDRIRVMVMRARARTSDPLAANMVLVDIREVDWEQALLLYRPNPLFFPMSTKSLSLESHVHESDGEIASSSTLAVCNITFQRQSKRILHVLYCSLGDILPATTTEFEGKSSYAGM